MKHTVIHRRIAVTYRHQRGASLLEGIAYLGIAAIVILGAVSLLTGAFSCLLVLILVEERIAPARPASWGPGRRLGSYLQWLALPVVGLLFSNLPALDAQTRLMAGRYLEYRVTEKS